MTIYSLDILLSRFGTSLLSHMSSSNCCFLIFIQISRKAGKVIWYSHLLNFLQFVVIYTGMLLSMGVANSWTLLNWTEHKGFGVINKAEVEVFLELSWFFYDPTDVGNLISGSFAFSKSSLNIWKFMVHILLKPGLGNFEHYFARMCDVCNCAIVWIFFGIAFLKDWNENRPFPVLWPTINVVGICSGWVGVWPTIGHTHNQ